MRDDNKSTRPGRLLEIVTGALECEPSARGAFLDEQCAGDAALRTEAESLLCLDEPARDFISRPAIAARAGAFLAMDPAPRPAATLAPGQMLGEFRVESLLGEGGMGEVYLAQDTSLGRLVALKLIKAGMASSTLLRRFGEEKRILAGLNDPHIARLYGGAVTPEGLPYLIMEYVEGEKLDDYCDGRRLSIEARLTLFRKICAAVAHAHQHLVVHRDLKPANIRVTPEGEPKLLDFGIAKLLDAQAEPAAEQTVTQLGAMTPGYASPEQLRGEAVTTATDIYSLGVVLYELLCGRRPFETRNRRPADVARAVCEETAARPGGKAPTAAVAEARGTTPGRLPRLLAGDLDNIVLMAMRREPARRYASVSQFSEDIRRHFEGQPVAARKETLRYVGAKFITRNKTLTAAVALILLTLVGGIVATTWQARRADEQRRRADRRFEDVRRLAHSLLFEMEPQMASLTGSTEVRSTLVRRALEYLDDLSREAGENRELRRELATAYEKVGDVQGNPQHPNLGDLKGGLASLRKAHDLLASLAAADPHDAQARHELAHNDELTGDVLWWASQTDGALASYLDALRLRRRLLAEQPRSPEFRRGFASLQMSIGDVMNWNGRSVEALANYGEALPVLQQLGMEHPDDAAEQIGIARCLARTGAAQKDLSNFATAAATFAQAENVMSPVLRQHPDNHAAVMEEWYILWRECEALNEQNATDKALAIEPRMVGLIEDVVQKDPKNTQTLNDLANSYNYCGRSFFGSARWQEAIDEYQKGLDIYLRLAQASPENGESAHSCGSSHADMGDARRHLGQFEAAVADEQQAQTLLETSVAKDPSNTAPSRDLVDVFVTRAKICEDQRKPAEARQWYERALAALEAVVAKKFTSKADPATFEMLHAKLAATPPST